MELQATDTVDDSDGELWPGENYLRQVEILKQHIGKRIYLCELMVTEINAAVQHTDREYLLLDIIDFPLADPKTNLYPHNILLDDGRGINLGRIASISTQQAFNPAPHNILYEDKTLINKLLPGKQRVTPESIRHTSRHVLAGILGQDSPARLVGKNSRKNDIR